MLESDHAASGGWLAGITLPCVLIQCGMAVALLTASTADPLSKAYPFR
jgi:hypothetical protein